MTGLTRIYCLQPQTEHLEELGCVSFFCCLFKFSFRFLAIVRNIPISSKLTHCTPSNQRTDKYICQASLAKTVTDKCLFSLPLHPTIPYAADDQQLLPLNEPESTALPPQIRLVLQHIWKLKKQTNRLLYARGKRVSGRKGPCWRKDLLSLRASAELSAGIFHGWERKALQRWEIPTGARSWKPSIPNSIWQRRAGCEGAGSPGSTRLQEVTHLGGSPLRSRSPRCRGGPRRRASRGAAGVPAPLPAASGAGSRPPGVWICCPPRLAAIGRNEIKLNQMRLC